MKYKNREKSKNIIDKRIPRKIRNNTDGEKYIFKMIGTIGPKGVGKSSKKNINAKKNKKPLSTKKFTKMDG
jgi:hypothetical protein